jgi:hypothetical protein
MSISLTEPLIGRAHANLDWSPRSHDTISLLLINVVKVVCHFVFMPPFSVLSFSVFCHHSHSLFPTQSILMFCHHSMFCHSHSLFCLSHSPLPAKLILIPPYSPRLAKIKKTHMSQGDLNT